MGIYTRPKLIKAYERLLKYQTPQEGVVEPAKEEKTKAVEVEVKEEKTTTAKAKKQNIKTEDKKAEKTKKETKSKKASDENANKN